MWEQITTLSEIDTINNSSLLARNNPEEGDPVYTVAGKNEDSISLKLKEGDTDTELTIPTTELFDKGWWMFKEQ